jgi:hypothetical protein
MDIQYKSTALHTIKSYDTNLCSESTAITPSPLLSQYDDSLTELGLQSIVQAPIFLTGSFSSLWLSPLVGWRKPIAWLIFPDSLNTSMFKPYRVSSSPLSLEAPEFSHLQRTQERFAAGTTAPFHRSAPEDEDDIPSAACNNRMSTQHFMRTRGTPCRPR